MRDSPQKSANKISVNEPNPLSIRPRWIIFVPQWPAWRYRSRHCWKLSDVGVSYGACRYAYNQNRRGARKNPVPINYQNMAEEFHLYRPAAFSPGALRIMSSTTELEERSMQAYNDTGYLADEENLWFYTNFPNSVHPDFARTDLRTLSEKQNCLRNTLWLELNRSQAISIEQQTHWNGGLLLSIWLHKICQPMSGMIIYGVVTDVVRPQLQTLCVRQPFRERLSTKCGDSWEIRLSNYCSWKLDRDLQEKMLLYARIITRTRKERKSWYFIWKARVVSRYIRKMLGWLCFAIGRHLLALDWHSF